MSQVLDFLSREKTGLATIAGIVIDLAVSFGLKLTVEQVVLFNGLILATLGLFARQTSTPISSPTLAQGTEVTVVTPEGQPNTTTVL